MSPTAPDRDLDAILARMLGPDARYRPGQRDAIESVLEDGARSLVLQATGWGKSIVYWIATRVRRDEGHGPTLIISPLLALMRNQIEMARRIGLRAVTVNSGNVEEWEDVRRALVRGEADVLLVSPERLGNERFLREFLPAIEGSLGLFVVDEVHCISDWGHDFRPDYRRIGAILRELPAQVPVLGTTATANQRVLDDVAAQLGHGARIIAGPLRRTSLRLGAFRMRDQSERLAWLAQHLPAIPGTGIVYCLTIADTERVADWLRSRGIDAQAYHAGLEPEARAALEEDLLANRVRVLVATVALGMGFDKPDLAFVIHFQRPGSVVAYYQQVGRAGRALPDAWGVLLSGREDDEIAEFFINQAFPPVAQQRAIVAALEERPSMTATDLEHVVDLSRGRIAAILKVLEVDGAVARDGSRYRRTDAPWEPDTERIASVTARRRAELAEMRAYVDHRGCLMRFLSEALDDPAAGDCGRCATEDPGYLPRDVDPAVAREAIAWLRGRPAAIEPRLMWPAGAVPGLSGRIKLPNEPGLALALEGDAGWGRAVAAGLAAGAVPSDALDAAADLARSRWHPRAAAGWWVTAVPTAGSGVVSDAARSLADRLGLPFRPLVGLRTQGAEEPGGRANSVGQLRAAQARLDLVGEPPPGPVVLVTDRVDSRWTVTLAGHLLRTAGAGPVHPLALLQSVGGAGD